MIDTVIDQLRARQDELLDQSQTVVATATGEKRDMTVEEGQQVDSLTAEFDRVGLEIGRREKILSQMDVLNTPRGRVTDPDPIEDVIPPPADVLRPQIRVGRRILANLHRLIHSRAARNMLEMPAFTRSAISRWPCAMRIPALVLGALTSV